MSAREWVPGHVALVIARWREGAPETAIAVREEGGWRKASDMAFVWDRYVNDVRLLVVIDPEDRDQITALLLAYGIANNEGNVLRCVDKMQAALRSLTEPPRVDEPSIWGVVEASCCHSDDRRKWVRHEHGNWWPSEKYGAAETRSKLGRDPRLPDCWEDLIDPVVVREGVQP